MYMQAIILSRRDFRENDQIISLYAKEKGKLKALARGVKKITSKNSAHLEPFSLVEAEIIPGKEISHLTKAVAENIFPNIRQDLPKSLVAGYVVSLLDQVLHEGERDEKVFSLTLGFLEFLNFKFQISNFKLLLDSYIVKLLNCLGFDITQADNLPVELKKDLEVLNSEDWQRISDVRFQNTEYRKLHDFIYQFFILHTEFKAKNWLNLVKF